MANEVRIRVSGTDTSKPVLDGAERNMRKVDKAADDMSSGGLSRSQKGFAAFTEVAGKGSAVLAGVTVAAAGATKMLNDGITVALTEANAKVALGEKGFQTLSTAAEENANAMGFTRSEFLNTAGSAAALAKNLGFSQENAAKLGAAFPDLADKLAILSNGKIQTAEAADQLRSAMAGEFDPLQAAGIAINAAAVETEALRIQQESATRVTKEQATAMAVLAIVQRQTADASKVMGTEAGRAASEAQAAQAELREAYEDLSRSAVPVLKELTQATAGWMQSWSNLTDIVERSEGETFKDLANVLAPMTNIVDALRGKTDEQGDASKKAALDVMALGEGATGAAESQEDLAEATTEAVDAIKEQIDVVLGGRDAARSYQEALDEATAALGENGRTLDINTEQGRANSEALDRIAEAARGQAEAVRAAGGSEADYRGQLERSRADLVRTAEKFGMSKAAARAYAQSILGIPRKADTRVFLDSRGALQGIDRVAVKMARLDGTIATTYINVVGSGRFVSDVAQSRGEKRAGGVWGGTAAAGGARSGMVLVGEDGPELVQPGAGAFVHTAGATRRMMAGAGAAGGGEARGLLEIRSGGSDLDELFLRILRRVIRQRGGNVQVVLGTGRGQTSATV